MNANQEQRELVNGPGGGNSVSETDAEETKEQQRRRNEWLKERTEVRRKQQIQFIITQTNYDEMEASQKLEEYNNDVMKVVSEYLGIGEKKDENVKKTKNQKVFSVIREMMDSGSRNFIKQQKQQERTKKIEELKKYMEKRNQQNTITETPTNDGCDGCDDNNNTTKTMKEKVD
jgi:hypothetical protein